MQIVSPTERRIEIVPYGIDYRKRLSELNATYKDMGNFLESFFIKN
jgi:hypothetical protein